MAGASSDETDLDLRDAKQFLSGGLVSSVKVF
jgi:hypothetical protein